MHGSGKGPTTAASVIPRELSDTAWATECVLTYLQGIAGKPWFLHLGYYRPHPPFIAPAPYNTLYKPEDVPALARCLARGRGQATSAARLLYVVSQTGKILSGWQGWPVPCQRTRCV